MTTFKNSMFNLTSRDVSYDTFLFTSVYYDTFSNTRASYDTLPFTSVYYDTLSYKSVSNDTLSYTSLSYDTSNPVIVNKCVNMFEFVVAPIIGVSCNKQIKVFTLS